MGKKQKITKEVLRSFCVAHEQVVRARQEHLQKGDGSQIVLNMYDTQIRELEGQITTNLKSWLSQQKVRKT